MTPLGAFVRASQLSRVSLPEFLLPGSVVVAAHPDDESVGAAVVISRSSDVAIAYLTDGAPADPELRTSGPDESRDRYRARRQTERSNALRRLGVASARVFDLGTPDQDAAFHLVELTRTLTELLHALRPASVLVQPYEGGHPDHDAAAFATRAAAQLLSRAGAPAFELWEMTSYHVLDGGLMAGRFLPGSGKGEVTLRLSAEEIARKSETLACYESQQGILGAFPLELERFRRAPSYDFTRPPHAPPVLYERFGWPMRCTRFCELAREAAVRLEIDATCL